MIGGMSRTRTLLVGLAMFGLAVNAVAEEKQADKKSGKPDKIEDDVVLDNRGMAKDKALAEEEKEAEMFENDTPFANAKPDPVGQREQRWKPGFAGAGHLGFAFPMGDYSGNEKFSDDVDGLIFIGGEFGYWPAPFFFVGLGLSGGYVMPDCSDEASCSGWQLRGGPMVLFRIEPHRNVTPFIGLGAGYEWMTTGGSTEVVSVRHYAHGLEYLNAQAGLEVRSRGDFYGVFVSYSMGKFTKESLSIKSDALGDSDSSGDIRDPKIHSWFGIGMRAAIN